VLPKRVERGAFELEVAVGVAARGDDARVSEVITDDSEIDAGLEQRTGTAMAKRVRCYSFGKRFIMSFRGGGILSDEMCRAVSGKREGTGSAEDRRSGIVIVVRTRDQRLECGHRIRP